MGKVLDLTGLRFGRWIVEEFDRRDLKNGRIRIYWNCLCDCGVKRSVHSSSLVTGKSLSCGCLQKEANIRTSKIRVLKRKPTILENGLKTCSICHQNKPINEFNRNSKDWEGYSKGCKACQKGRSLYTKYRITLDQHRKIWETQNGKCALCKKVLKYDVAVVDHSHDTGDIRGLVHSNCNASIGMANDNPETLLNSFFYILKDLNFSPKGIKMSIEDNSEHEILPEEWTPEFKQFMRNRYANIYIQLSQSKRYQEFLEANYHFQEIANEEDKTLTMVITEKPVAVGPKLTPNQVLKIHGIMAAAGIKDVVACTKSVMTILGQESSLIVTSDTPAIATPKLVDSSFKKDLD